VLFFFSKSLPLGEGGKTEGFAGRGANPIPLKKQKRLCATAIIKKRRAQKMSMALF